MPSRSDRSVSLLTCPWKKKKIYISTFLVNAELIGCNAVFTTATNLYKFVAYIMKGIGTDGDFIWSHKSLHQSTQLCEWLGCPLKVLFPFNQKIPKVQLSSISLQSLLQTSIHWFLVLGWGWTHCNVPSPTGRLVLAFALTLLPVVTMHSNTIVATALVNRRCMYPSSGRWSSTCQRNFAEWVGAQR